MAGEVLPCRLGEPPSTLHLIGGGLQLNLRPWQVEAVQPVWDGLWNLLPPLADVEKLMKATPGSEDLRKGALPPQWALRGLRDGLAHFLDSVPEYPTHAFQGRGVVVTGGSIKYWSAAVLTFSSLRKQGCNLPGELWVLGSELSGLPSKVIGILQEELGVSVRVLPQDVYPGGGGYRAKVCAIVSSRFSEVLFMDADNIAVSNPCELFESPEYQQTGAILWQDFWDPSPATVHRSPPSPLDASDQTRTRTSSSIAVPGSSMPGSIS